MSVEKTPEADSFPTLYSVEDDKYDSGFRKSKQRQAAILLAAFLLNFSGCGLLFSWGIYESLYEDMARVGNTPFTGASSAEISLIGSISAALTKLGAPYVVAWCKCFRPQLVICVGGLIFGVASVLASFSITLWQFQLTQGLLMGIGTCLSYMPSMVVPPSWFGKHRGLSMGIISAGTGIGGLVWSPVLTASIQHIGFRNTLRLTGCVCTVIICASGAVLDWEPTMRAQLQENDTQTSRTSRLFRVPLPSRRIVMTRKFLAQSLNAILQATAYYTPIFFIASFAKTLSYSDIESSNFTALSNACNAVGKIGIGFVADRIGRLDSFVLSTLMSTVSTAGLWASSAAMGTTNESAGRQLFISFVVVYGIFASAYIGLFSPVLAEIFGMANMPHVTGIMYMLQGAAGFVGTPVAGTLVRMQGDKFTPESYLSMATLVGVLMAASTVTACWARMEVMLERGNGIWSWQWHL